MPRAPLPTPGPVAAAPTAVPEGEDRAGTLRGAALMAGSMACFAVEDAVIKAMGARIPAAQIIWMLGLGGAAALGLWLAVRPGPVWPPEARHPMVMLRTAFEVAAALCYVPALVLIPLATATAILQAAPLVVAGGAVLFLGIRVGWRRWAAIGAGFAGVLLILRPGADFEPATVLAVVGTVALGGRDLVTRRAPPGLSSARLSLVAYVALIPTAMLLQAALGQPLVLPGAADWGRLAVAVGIGLVGYVAVVAAMRVGDVAVVSSLRYARMVFALALAMLVFGERPDALALAGIAVIVGAGLYALAREARTQPGR